MAGTPDAGSGDELTLERLPLIPRHDLAQSDPAHTLIGPGGRSGACRCGWLVGGLCLVAGALVLVLVPGVRQAVLDLLAGSVPAPPFPLSSGEPPGTAFDQSLPFVPLMVWARVMAACGLLLLAEALTPFFALRRQPPRPLVRWLTLLPLVAGAGTLTMARRTLAAYELAASDPSALVLAITGVCPGCDLNLAQVLDQQQQTEHLGPPVVALTAVLLAAGTIVLVRSWRARRTASPSTASPARTLPQALSVGASQDLADLPAAAPPSADAGDELTLEYSPLVPHDVSGQGDPPHALASPGGRRGACRCYWLVGALSLLLATAFVLGLLPVVRQAVLDLLVGGVLPPLAPISPDPSSPNVIVWTRFHLLPFIPLLSWARALALCGLLLLAETLALFLALGGRRRIRWARWLAILPLAASAAPFVLAGQTLAAYELAVNDAKDPHLYETPPCYGGCGVDPTPLVAQLSQTQRLGPQLMVLTAGLLVAGAIVLLALWLTRRAAGPRPPAGRPSQQ
jgi:hypothetical protein